MSVIFCQPDSGIAAQQQAFNYNGDGYSHNRAGIRGRATEQHVRLFARVSKLAERPCEQTPPVYGVLVISSKSHHFLRTQHGAFSLTHMHERGKVAERSFTEKD